MSESTLVTAKTFVVYGNLQRKSNSRRIVRNRRTGNAMLIKSAKALSYQQQFLTQMMSYRPYKIITKDVRLEAVIYYQSRRNDLSDELLCDLIEKSGLLKNDRQIREKWLIAKIDKNNPRVKFRIIELARVKK